MEPEVSTTIMIATPSRRIWEKPSLERGPASASAKPTTASATRASGTQTSRTPPAAGGARQEIERGEQHRPEARRASANTGTARNASSSIAGSRNSSASMVTPMRPGR